MGKFNDFVWEDASPEPKYNAKREDDFAELLNQENFAAVELTVGEKVSGTIVSLKDDSNTVLIEISASQTGVMDKGLLHETHPQAAQGDQLDFYVLALTDGSIQLGTKLGGAMQSAKDLELAYRNQIPVPGKVTAVIKGGFEVTVFGRRAFCPVSGLHNRYIQTKETFIGSQFDFHITQYQANGRNIVVSRSKLLAAQAAERREELEQALAQEQAVSGKIIELRDYGAVVDLGGMDGFLHISEISHMRLDHPSDTLVCGESIQAKVLSIGEKDGKTRISLSMKAVLQDPWEMIDQNFQVGQSYPGTVVRLDKFGAFVTLTPGIDGLIHVSEMSWQKRVHHPSEVLQKGDEVNVRILDIDKTRQKISLSLKDLSADPWADVTTRFAEGSEHMVLIESLKGFGAIAQLSPGLTGLIPMGTLKAAFGESYKKQASPPKELKVVIARIEQEQKKILLTLPQVQQDDDDQDYKNYLASETSQSKVSPKQRGSFGDLLAKKLGQK